MDQNQKPDSRRKSNTELAQQMRAGDNAAAGSLVERLSPWLRKVVDRKIGVRLQRRIDADDIMQSAFWSFCRRTSEGQYEFEHSGALCRMLLTIAENKIRRAGTHHARQCRDVGRELALDVGAMDLTDPQWEQMAGDLVEEVAYVVDQLPDRDAEFFRRRYFVDQSAGQISAETGWSLTTVKRTLKHTLEEIRERLEEDR